MFFLAGITSAACFSAFTIYGAIRLFLTAFNTWDFFPYKIVNVCIV